MRCACSTTSAMASGVLLVFRKFQGATALPAEVGTGSKRLAALRTEPRPPPGRSIGDAHGALARPQTTVGGCLVEFFERRHRTQRSRFEGLSQFGPVLLRQLAHLVIEFQVAKGLDGQRA